LAVRLSVLCQSPVSEGRAPADAVRETIALAKCADEAGYHRFWVAEHHSDRALASGAPAVMVGAVAAATSRIRVGSGGVLMLFHSPFHVAEQFNLLAALHPGRVDLGLGRSAGSEAHAPEALGVRAPGDRAFAAMDEALSWLGTGAPNRPFPDTFASPAVDRSAEPWVLGTSVASAAFAASRGLPYAFGGFLDPRGLVPCLTAYHEQFRPGRFGDRPKALLAWYAQAAATDAEARDQAGSSEQWFVETFLRRGNPLIRPSDPERARGWSPMEQMMVAMRREFAVVGAYDRVAAGLAELASRYAVDEVMVVTLAHDAEARRASYRGIAEASS
jgi:luciferase family oxidoreductase group 1